MDIDFIKSYSKLLLEDGYEEADKLKNAKIPDVLYKYFPCSENRVNSLSKQQLWLTQHKTFNDPNEFKFMFIDKNKFEKAELIGQKWEILYNYYGENFFKVRYQDAIKFMEEQKNSINFMFYNKSSK